MQVTILYFSAVQDLGFLRPLPVCDDPWRPESGGEIAKNPIFLHIGKTKPLFALRSQCGSFGLACRFCDEGNISV